MILITFVINKLKCLWLAGPRAIWSNLMFAIKAKAYPNPNWSLQSNIVVLHGNIRLGEKAIGFARDKHSSLFALSLFSLIFYVR
jgi:hypothetical protein